MPAPSVSQYLFGSTPSLQQYPERYSPQQRQFQQQSLSNLNNILGNISQPTDISGITNDIRRRFETETLPSLSERFVSLGQSPGRSTAFGGGISGAAANLESQLGSLEAQNVMSDKNRLMQLFSLLSGPALTPQREFYGEPGTTGLFSPGSGSSSGLAGLFSLLRLFL